MINPNISVIMSVYQEDQFLASAINSILTQTYTDFEFIIINDNPKVAALGETLRRYKDNDSRIVLLENESNLGLGESLNRGLQMAKGRYIARMDSDDISLKDRFEEQVKFLDSHADVALVGTWAERIDEKSEKHGLMTLPADSDTLNEMLRYTTAAYHPTWMFRRDILKEITGYRSFPVAQDYDFLWRLFDAGFKVGNIQKILFNYRFTNNNASVKKFYQQWKLRKYILKLHSERMKTGHDTFSESCLDQVMYVRPILQKITELSQVQFEKAVIAKRDNLNIKFFLYLFLSILIFPPKLEVLYSTFKSKQLLNSKGMNG